MRNKDTRPETEGEKTQGVPVQVRAVKSNRKPKMAPQASLHVAGLDNQLIAHKIFFMEDFMENITMAQAVKIANAHRTSFRKSYIRVSDRKTERFEIEGGWKMTLVPIVYSKTWSKWSIRFYTPAGKYVTIKEAKRTISK